jgi:hypothetical protein
MAQGKVYRKSDSRILFSFLILSLLITYANAADIYVYPQTEQQNVRELNMSSASTVMYPNIQAAIDAAASGDVIYLAPARWKGDGNRDLDFKGKAITVSGFNPNDPNIVAATIIDCNGTETNQHRGFYFHSGEDNNSVVCGITITNGYASRDGIAIYCYQSDPCIHHNNIVSNNGVYGSVIYLGSSSILTHCTVADNNANNAITAYGYYNKKIKIENCIVKNNKSTGIYGGENLEISNCQIENNQSWGIYMRGAASISDCIIRRNGKMNGRDGSGGIYGRCYIKNCSIIENIGTGLSYCQEALNCFIAYNSNNGAASCQTIINSKIIGNGGIGITSPNLIENCVIAKNKKQGIRYPYGNVTNCTIIDNNSTGVWVSSSAVNIANCIIRDNYREQIKGVTSTTKIQYTNSYDTSNSYLQTIPYAGIGNINEEPNFISEKDYHLAAGSLCVDAGTNDANFISEANDIEGSARIIDGDSNGNAKADMGAYEYNTNQPVIAVWADRIVCLTNAGEIKGKIYIKNAGTGSLNYNILSDEDWLMINNPAGTSAGEIQEVNVSIEPNNLTLGDYYCRIKVFSNEAVNSQQEYWLNVHIGSLWTVPTDANTIQAAINRASNYDYIRVMDGNYSGEGNRNINFNGKNLTVYSTSGISEQCKINCGISNYGFRFNNHETEGIIDGLSIINASDCILADVCSSPIIRNCKLLKSRDGIYLQGYSSVKAENCIFENDNYGVMSNNEFNKIIINDCEIKNINRGGAFYLYKGNSIVIRNCKITKAKNYSKYGLIKKIVYENCSLRDHSSGVIEMSRIGEFVIRNSDIMNNIRFGIIINDCGKVEVSDCTLTNTKSPYTFTYSSALSIKGNLECSVKNCLIAGNDYGCSLSIGDFENCTFNGNRRSSVDCDYEFRANFKNCILWDANIFNKPLPASPAPKITYCDVKGGWEGVGNIDVEPEFVAPGYLDANGTPMDANDDFWVDGDYHLKSEGWRWDADSNEWGYDDVTSRCIDAGSPGYGLGDEVLTVPEDPANEFGENLRIDMGCYGGTAEASIPPYRWALLSDMDNSGRVNMEDFSYLANSYGTVGENIDGDFNRDAKVDLDDAALLADDWLKVTTWERMK